MSETRPHTSTRGADAPSSGPGSSTDLPIASGALRVNLRRTAAQVRIPAHQRVLLDVVRSKVGIHRQTELLLREANHPYANWDELVEPLRSRALGDFHYYKAHERGPEALAVFFQLFLSCMKRCRLAARRKRAFLSLLDFFEMALLESGAARERNRPVLDDTVLALEAWLPDEPLLAAQGTSRIRKLAGRVLNTSGGILPIRLPHLFVEALRQNLRLWSAEDDPAAWYRRERDRLLDGRDCEELFRPLSHAWLAEERERLEQTARTLDADPAGTLSACLSIADFASVSRTFTQTAHALEDPTNPRTLLHKIHYLLHILDIPALRDQNEALLRELGRCLERIRGQEEAVWEDFLCRVFVSLRGKTECCGSAVLDCVHTLGREVYHTGSPRLRRLLIEELVELGFQHPDVQGVNRDWQVMVNPLHLKNIRTWLDLVRLDPPASRELISALLVNLRIGGLFVSDTDLFQKDISRLLSADIGECFSAVKALARLFPVYFHEIGAEGELRDVSTAVDELCGRHDILIHFLRKQCHVESHNRIIPFIERIAAYWRSGRRDLLEAFVPPEVYEQIPEPNGFQAEMAPIFRKLTEEGRHTLRDVTTLSPREIYGIVQSARTVPEHARRKAELLLRLYRLLVRKYTVHHDEILEALRASNFFDAADLTRMRDLLVQGRPEEAVEQVLRFMDRLRRSILSADASVPQEEIYHKRHIAAGIPSMYGRYKERRFDSLGLTFRLESLAEVLFDRITGELNLAYVTRSTLHRVCRILQLYTEALRVDGIVIEALAANLALLAQALEARDFSVDQYLNIFQFIASTVKEIIQTQYIAVHERNLRTVIRQMAASSRPLPGQASDGLPTEEAVCQTSEWFTRDLLAHSFAVQRLDGFIGKVLASLAQETQSLDRKTRSLLLSFDPDGCLVPFHSTVARVDSSLYLGNKGYYLKRLDAFGHPVPPGFIISTEFFRCRRAILAYPAAEEHYLEGLRREVRRLEKRSGLGFGDPGNPLLLSVRSGSTISMPGMLDTFLNIGLNERITRALARKPRFEWAAWDNYRRFLQCWGMSLGIPRDRFDELMTETKRVYTARYKRELQPDQMQDLALAYRRLLQASRVTIPDDPWQQLQQAVLRVLASWHSEPARLYRQAMKIAEEWGTAVVVQKMVFGNLDASSGTGVAFTRNPRQTDSEVRLFGDYTVCAQGEDVVSGLVATHPISEHQRVSEGSQTEHSLERAFPVVYRHLERLAADLIHKRGFNHQDIEFTFEAPDAASLYILQARDLVPAESPDLRVFRPTPHLRGSLLETGIGVGGGALSGIVVHLPEEIERLRREHPGVPLIVLRPDTVPEDIHMILKTDGLLTARGGSTSHAAVTAYRLGKTCVVGCRQLQVNEKRGRSEVRGQVLRTGDWIGVDGRSGCVFRGRHETMPAQGTDRH